MNFRIVILALLTAGLALVPALYLAWLWPQVQAFVPTHYGPGGVPNQFVGREWLRGISWWPGLAWVVLTFLPQVQDGQSLFWSSRRQRRTRLVVVGSLMLFTTSIVQRGAHHSRPVRELRPTPRPAPVP